MNYRLPMLLLLLPLALCACVRNGATPPAPPQATAPAQAGDGAALTGYAWTLESATDPQGRRIEALFPGKGLVLAFADGSASVSGGCNRMGGRYAFDATRRLVIGPMRATRMACMPALMQADEAIGALLAQPQQVELDGEPPRLRMLSAAGEHTRWTGVATAEARYGGPGETVFLEVAPQRIACHHPLKPDDKCLQVRERHYDTSGIKQPPGEWRAFYGDIEGFTFREGERKVLRLKKFRRDPAPADASSVVYVLDMVVESELVPADGAK